MGVAAVVAAEEEVEDYLALEVAAAVAAVAAVAEVAEVAAVRAA